MKTALSFVQVRNPFEMGNFFLSIVGALLLMWYGAFEVVVLIMAGNRKSFSPFDITTARQFIEHMFEVGE